MRLRKLALAVGAVTIVASNLGFALGLGEIKLNSALNQPLDAEIKLLQVRDLGEDEVVVRLASRDAFERANVERLFFLSNIKFEVVLDDPANPHVKVTSREVVREPYLNFLLETQWPTGRMLREYTLLLDLPTFGDKSRQTVAAPSQQPAAKPTPTTQPAPVAKQPTRASQPTPTPTPAPRASVSGQDYKVYADDTLWDIALKARPDRSYSVQQTMLAIQRLNPDAFINDNINLLRKGQVLRLPSADDIAALSSRQAINEVAYQNSQWSGGATLEGSRRSGAVADRQDGREGRVQLTAGSSAEDASSGQGSGGDSRNTAALQNELAISQESFDVAKRENTELQSRVVDLEEQIQTMERLLQVTSEELRALQLAAGKEVTAPAVAEPAPTAQTETATPAVETKPEPTPAPANVVRSSAPEPTIVDLLLDNIAYLAAALVALLAGLFIWKRRSDDQEFEETELEPFGNDEFDGVEDDQFEFAEEPVDDFDSQVEEEQEDSLDDLEVAEAETADVAGEADIYIAYGKYDQAEDMLVKALDREPGRVDVTLKLLEVYAETKDLEAFDRHYAAIHDDGDLVSQQRAEELRETIPGAGAFDRTMVQAVVGATAATALAVDDEVDDVNPLLSLAAEGEQEFDGLEGLDEDFGTLTDLNESDAEAVDLEEGFGDLDFSLDELEEETDDGATEAFSLDLDDVGTAAEPSADSDEFSLDLGDDELSLDLGGEAEKPTAAAMELKPAATEDDFSLDFDAEEAAPEELSLDDDLLSLSEPAVDEPKTQDGDAVEFDLALDDDLDLDAAVPAPASPAKEEVPTQGAEDDAVVDFSFETEDEDNSSLSVEADDFDASSDLADFDIAALDKEMDSLSAGLEATDGAPAADEFEEFDISADLGIENGADELPPLQDESSGDAAPQASASAGDADEDFDAELGFLADSDEVATKLDLARAYIDMGDSEGAKDILSEVLEEGDEQQRGEAEELMGRMG